MELLGGDGLQEGMLPPYPLVPELLGQPGRVCLPPELPGTEPVPQFRQRHYRTLLAPSGDAAADDRDTRWATQCAVGSPVFVAQYIPTRRRRPRLGGTPALNQEVMR